jgi:hypothetical protein
MPSDEGTWHSVKGNETPKLREFRSQPPNCGAELAVGGRQLRVQPTRALEGRVYEIEDALRRASAETR